MRKLLLAAVALTCAAACSGSSTSHEDPITAGPGIKIDPSTHAIGVDDSRVPMMPACAAGQLVRRGANGWECTASAPDSAQLGGKAAASYLTTDAMASNASNLEGHPATFFLAAAAQAADSALLGGLSAASYQLAANPAADSLKLGGLDAAAYLKAGGVAADSAKLGGKDASAYQLASVPAANAANAMALNGHPDTFFLAATGVAADSGKLGGTLASGYLKTTGVAADSSKLGGVDASGYLKTGDAAADSAKLGGVAAAKFVRSDVAATLTAPVSIATSGVQVASVDGKGSLTASFVSAERDVIAKRAVFTTTLNADGNAHVVGDVAAGSFNGLALFPKNGVNASCDSLCLESGGTCVAAKIALPLPGRVLKAARCDGSFAPLPFDAACFCASMP